MSTPVWTEVNPPVPFSEFEHRRPGVVVMVRDDLDGTTRSLVIGDVLSDGGQGGCTSLVHGWDPEPVVTHWREVYRA